LVYLFWFKAKHFAVDTVDESAGTDAHDGREYEYPKVDDGAPHEEFFE
jgi:hypothetical protein